MNKYLIIILFIFSCGISYADDNVEQMATTLGDGTTPTVGTTLLLNIKPRTNNSASSWESETATEGSSNISIIGGQVKKRTSSTSASGVSSGAGISNFNSGRRSSVAGGGTTVSSISDDLGGPKKVGGRPGEVPDEEAPLGAVPLAFMLLLALGFSCYKRLKISE